MEGGGQPELDPGEHQGVEFHGREPRRVAPERISQIGLKVCGMRRIRVAECPIHIPQVALIPY
ncbi:hypothetical protein LBMAG53_02940 [Planctomycetota bacterium]|nr:hypothetical protein LBMAG53_02940 [Planctomycetota bacterium]